MFNNLTVGTELLGKCVTLWKREGKGAGIFGLLICVVLCNKYYSSLVSTSTHTYSLNYNNQLTGFEVIFLLFLFEKSYFILRSCK